MSSLKTISRSEFRRKIGLLLLAHVTILTLTLGSYYLAWESRQVENQTIAFGILLIFQIPLSILFFSYIGMRLRDIDPNYPKTSFLWFAFYCACPITGIPFLLFLALRANHQANQKLPLPIRQPARFAIVLIVLAVSLPISNILFLFSSTSTPLPLAKLSYGLLNPTGYFITFIGEEARLLMNTRKELPDSPANHMQVFKAIAQNGQIDTTGFILMQALVVSSRMKEKTENKSPTPASNRQTSLGVINDILTVMEWWENRRPTPILFNPLSFLFPQTTMEIALLTMVNILIDAKYSKVLFDRLPMMLEKLEKQSQESPEGYNEMRKGVAELRIRFKALKSYNTSTTPHDSWVGQQIFSF